MLYDASRVEEINTSGIAHTVDLACGAAEDHRCIKCSIEVKGETDIENNREKKKKINIDTSSAQNPFLCAEFQRRLWALPRSLETAFLTMPRNFRVCFEAMEEMFLV